MNKAKIALAIALCFAVALVFSCSEEQGEMCKPQKQEQELTDLQQAKIDELAAERIAFANPKENVIPEKWIGSFAEAYQRAK